MLAERFMRQRCGTNNRTAYLVFFLKEIVFRVSVTVLLVSRVMHVKEVSLQLIFPCFNCFTFLLKKARATATATGLVFLLKLTMRLFFQQ
jgi:hypothetical protein